MFDIAALNSWVIYKKVTGEKISSRNFILGLVESWTTKNVAKTASLRPDSISNNLSPPKRRKCAVKGCVNTTKTVCHICHLHTCGKCGQASNNTMKHKIYLLYFYMLKTHHQ